MVTFGIIVIGAMHMKPAITQGGCNTYITSNTHYRFSNGVHPLSASVRVTTPLSVIPVCSRLIIDGAIIILI